MKKIKQRTIKAWAVCYEENDETFIYGEDGKPKLMAFDIYKTKTEARKIGQFVRPCIIKILN